MSPAERRQLTVLFCDLVDSTGLSVRLDPEDLREVMRAYQKFVGDTVARFGGFVSQYTGDGVMVYFGWPQAQEHDAERAVRTGLALVGDVAGHAWPFGVELAIRVGIATGVVLVESRDVAGETPNLAARLQTQAEPNTVVIGPVTFGLVRGLFEYRDLGERPLKGFAAPLRIRQVLGESKAASRFDALRGRNLGALLGREEELSLLLGHWQEARKGGGRVVLLTGEAGIGKSRLTRALMESVEGEPHRRLRYFCLPHHTDSPLHPVIGQIGRAAGFERGDDAATRLDKLQAVLTYLATSPQDAALIADLLSIDGAGKRWPLPDLAPPQRKQRTLDALRRSIEAQAGRLPILAVFEDVHWIDPTSLELLDRTIVALQQLPVLLVVTARPGFEAPWADRPYASELPLNRLRRTAAAELVRQIGRDLTDDMAREILDQADGVPLFIEELTRAVVEGGKEAPATSGIPTSLQASLMSRLDRLGPAKELAQLSAVIGRRFSWTVLATIAERSEPELAAGLEQLTAAGLIFPEGSGPHRTYRFKHALVQSAAYESLLRSARQRLHARVAAILEARFPATLPQQVAAHWAQAGEAARAAACWQKAGEQSIRRGANREAIALLFKGLDALMRVPESAERDQTELSLQLALAEALIADRGWTAAETQPCWTRARELCERTGETTALFPILYGQFSTSLSRGAPDMHDLAQQALQLTQGGDGGLSAVAHAMAGMSHFARGRFWVARVELEIALSLSGAAGRTSTFVAADHNIAIASLWLAMTLLQLGLADAAAGRAAAGLAAARRLDNPHTMAHALALHCRYLSIAGDVRALHRAAEDLAVLAAEHRFPFYAAAADIYRGWVLAERDIVRGLQMLRDGTDAFVALGATALRPWFLGRMAMLSAALGEVCKGIDLLDEALQEIDRTGQRWCRDELMRLKTELRARASCRAA